MTKRVLILCTGNSCRSQMAEGFWNAIGAGTWQADSAGSNPAGYVHPMAIEAMRDEGIDLSAARSKHLDEFQNTEFELVITVCDNARESCPTFPGAKQVLHWPFEDPAHAEGTEDEKRAAFRRIRDQIRQRIATYLATPT